LSDLPWQGIPVRIELRVRRFFCDSADCRQQIFTERLPKTVQRYSRRTCRLSASLQQITSALGGFAGSRLAKQLGILASGSTRHRQLRRKLIKPSAQGPRVLVLWVANTVKYKSLPMTPHLSPELVISYWAHVSKTVKDSCSVDAPSAGRGTQV
jgi:hypothetical protein